MDNQWEEAENYLNECIKAYKEIGFAGRFGLMYIYPLKDRLDRGIRTDELYDEIMGISL